MCDAHGYDENRTPRESAALPLRRGADRRLRGPVHAGDPGADPRQPETAAPASGPGRNYWCLYGTSTGLPSKDNPTNPFEDPRIVYVFMVPFGSFRGSGNAILPIVSFGIFYVRGWGGNGGGNDDPCPNAIPNVPAGDLAGNFITHVADSATASGTEACVIGSFNPCVTVMTK